MPGLILNESVIRAQVHGRLRAVRAARHEIRRQDHGEFSVLRHIKHPGGVFHKALGRKRLIYPRFVPVRLLHLGLCLLEEPVIALGAKEPALSKA